MAQQQQVLSKYLFVLVFKQYDLASANKKIDLTHPPCPRASKILREILRRHPLCFALIASALVPWIYIQLIFYYIINNVHVDYATLPWEGLHYSLMHPTTVIPYPRFIKIIIDHILTEHPDIPKRLNEPYHIVEYDEEMKHTKNYKDCVAEFQIEVLMTQSQPIESTQGTHRTPSAPRPPNPQEQKVSIATTRSIEDYKAQQVVKKVDEHLMDDVIEKIVEGDEEINADNFVDDVGGESADDMSFDEEVEEESAEAALIRKKGKGIMEIKDTPLIPMP
ncbi:hypothetical protein Tco_1224241 [Tanacetum coccineum]